MQPTYFDDAPTRAALLNFLTCQFETFSGLCARRTTLAEWLKVLDTRTIAGCLRQAPGQTADALSVAILRRAAELDPGEAIGDLIADSYPRLSHADRERLRLLTITVRRLAHENDGHVLDSDLLREGFGLGEQRRFIAQVHELLAITDGRAVLRDAHFATDPAARLAMIGQRIAMRQPSASPHSTAR